ncbi:unnamed protein product [Gongylonema pulchrum]|uniref:CUE domain-containing protein n=1 Tax=Gongylonema pulchrum TaxID=637853 RepID=A0A183DZ30_9BILA|nr:unnamed protein product [Gongylonema pulchrum]
MADTYDPQYQTLANMDNANVFEKKGHATTSTAETSEVDYVQQKSLLIWSISIHMPGLRELFRADGEDAETPELRDGGVLPPEMLRPRENERRLRWRETLRLRVEERRRRGVRERDRELETTYSKLHTK